MTLKQILAVFGLALALALAALGLSVAALVGSPSSAQPARAPAVVSVPRIGTVICDAQACYRVDRNGNPVGL